MIPPPSPKRSKTPLGDDAVDDLSGVDPLDGALSGDDGAELLVPTEPGDTPSPDVEEVVDLELDVPTQIASG